MTFHSVINQLLPLSPEEIDELDSFLTSAITLRSKFPQAWPGFTGSGFRTGTLCWRAQLPAPFSGKIPRSGAMIRALVEADLNSKNAAVRQQYYIELK